MTRFVSSLARTMPTTLLTVAVLSGLAMLVGFLFRLTVAGTIGLYFVVWWTLLFAVLPVSIRTQAEEGDIVPGSDPGAPSNPGLRERAIWTTIVSALVFVLVAAFFPLAGL